MGECLLNGHCQCLEHVANNYCCRCHETLPKKVKPVPTGHVEFKSAVDPFVSEALERLERKGALTE